MNNISINNVAKNNRSATKFIRIISFLLPFISFIVIKTQPNNDIYFMLPTGKYILENGFATKDFLTFHSSMDIVIQQWLSDIIFYKTYSVFGEKGLIALVFIVAALLILMVYYLIHIISGRHYISLFGTTVTAIYLFPSFLTTRPQIFSYLIIFAELICLEKYVKTKKNVHLIPIVFLSVALINLHASMWLMLFAYMFPYFIQALHIKLGKINIESKCRLIPLIVCAVFSLIAGFANPYGIKAMLYIFSSYGYDSINNFINEMKPVTITDTVGAAFFALAAAIILVYIIYRKGTFETRFVLLTVGTMFFGFTSYKAFAFFIIAAVPSLCAYIKDIKLKPSLKKKNKKTSLGKRSALRIAAVVIVLCAVCTAVISSQTNSSENAAAYDTNYSELRFSPIADELDKLPKDKIKLFCGFDAGPYFEFRGYKPYIDARAEIFFKVNNNDYDYYNEYIDLYKGILPAKDFVEKYDFTHLVVSDSEYCLKNYLDESKDFRIICETEKYTLYEKADFVY